MVQHRSAVADDDRVEAVQQGRRVPGVAEGDVEGLAEPGGQEDVLVAVAPSARLVGEIGDEQDGVAWWAGRGGQEYSQGFGIGPDVNSLAGAARSPS